MLDFLDDFFRNTKFAFVAFGISVLAFIIGQIPTLWFGPDIGTSIGAFFGFTGIASFRTFIESKGWRTQAIVVVGLLTVVLSFIVPFEILQNLVVMLFAMAGITLTYAVKKKQT